MTPLQHEVYFAESEAEAWELVGQYAAENGISEITIVSHKMWWHSSTQRWYHRCVFKFN